MKQILLTSLLIAIVYQVHARTEPLRMSSTYYITFGGDIIPLVYMTIREAPNLYEKYIPFSQGYFEIGSWLRNGDTLFVFPKYKIVYDSSSPRITFYDNYFDFKTLDEFRNKNFRYAKSYIIRQNGLFEERLLSTPFMPEHTASLFREVDPLDKTPLYFKIHPKEKHKKRYNKSVNNL